MRLLAWLAIGAGCSLGCSHDLSFLDAPRDAGKDTTVGMEDGSSDASDILDASDASDATDPCHAIYGGCSPETQYPCTAGQGCYYNTTADYQCMAAGTLTQGQACNSGSDCIPGYDCITTTLADGSMPADCEKVCCSDMECSKALDASYTCSALMGVSFETCSVP